MGCFDRVFIVRERGFAAFCCQHRTVTIADDMTSGNVF